MDVNEQEDFLRLIEKTLGKDALGDPTLLRMIDDMTGVYINDKKEVFDLWREVFFLKILLTQFINKGPSVFKEEFADCLIEARNKSKDYLEKRFPDIKFEFDKGLKDE